MSERDFQRENTLNLDLNTGFKCIEETLDGRQESIKELLDYIVQTEEGLYLIGPNGALLLSGVINPRDRSTEEPMYNAFEAYKAAAKGVLLGWVICLKDFRDRRLAPYGLLDKVIRDSGVLEGDITIERMEESAKCLVNAGGMGFALLGEKSEEAEELIDELEPVVRLQVFTKTGLGLILSEANKKVGEYDDLEKMRQGAINWDDLVGFCEKSV